MKRFTLLLFFLTVSNFFAQKDSLQLGDYYADDQLYFAITYSQFYNQPSSVSKSRFSYSLSTGFMKDFILNKRGSIAFALGAGYGYSTYNHRLKITEANNQTNFELDGSVSNEILVHNLELPFEIRWRSSTAQTYNFWRIYIGLKTTYNFDNTFSFSNETIAKNSFKNINAYKKWQYGLIFSAGYDAFNFHVYYGLTPIYNDALIGNEAINTKIIKFGLIYFIL